MYPSSALLTILSHERASLVAQRLKPLPTMQETWVQSLDWEDPLEKGMATHSSILAWRIPWTESLVGYRPWGRKASDTTENFTFTAKYFCSSLLSFCTLFKSKLAIFLLDNFLKKVVDLNTFHWVFCIRKSHTHKSFGGNTFSI